MQILKDKKLLVGSLAVIGGIAAVAYLLKPKAPKRNSEGFFNAIGTKVVEKTPISSSASCNLPDTFVRRVYTNNGLKSYCGRYDRLRQGNKPFLYRLQRDLTTDFVGVTFFNGNFYNSNNQIIGTNPPTLISYIDFENAFRTGQNC
jgi:hypothetical protein